MRQTVASDGAANGPIILAEDLGDQTWKSARNWLGNLDPTPMRLNHWRYCENRPI